jgi:hypothetical protein
MMIFLKKRRVRNGRTAIAGGALLISIYAAPDFADSGQRLPLPSISAKTDILLCRMDFCPQDCGRNQCSNMRQYSMASRGASNEGSIKS